MWYDFYKLEKRKGINNTRNTPPTVTNIILINPFFTSFSKKNTSIHSIILLYSLKQATIAPISAAPMVATPPIQATQIGTMVGQEATQVPAIK